MQKQGLGRQIMDHAEQLLRQLGCPKINLQVRTNNHEVIAFYERLGFVRDDVVSLGRRLVVD
nr:GNAT family N-acetyltransferase [Verrucomicrobium spinosum]